jgi:hypothetical protein
VVEREGKELVVHCVIQMVLSVFVEAVDVFRRIRRISSSNSCSNAGKSRKGNVPYGT